MTRHWVLGLLVGLSMAAARAAEAAPPPPPVCGDPTEMPNPIYIVTGDTQVPVLKRIGKRFRQLTSGAFTVVYIPTGSCANLAAMYKTPTDFKATAASGGPFYIPADPAWDETSVPPVCTLPTTAPLITADVGNTIVFADNKNCPTLGPKPANVGLFKGPTQGFVFVVPGGPATAGGSTQRGITAEMAYLIMGLGADKAMVPPWDDRHYIYGRPATKGTQIGIGANIGVDAATWKLLPNVPMGPTYSFDQSDDLAAKVAMIDANAEKTLGILGTEIYDKATNRAAMHSLAFRGYGQLHGYWPDSTPTSFDKRNIRDGHYLLWSYVQYIAPIDTGTGQPTKPEVKQLIDAMLANPLTTTPAFEPLTDIVASGLVPGCAMKVQRQNEGGTLSLYDAQQPCGCFFDAKVPGGSTSCAVCDTNTPCASGTCRHGYCEAK